MRNNSVVRAYDIRGIVDVDLFSEDYCHIGLAFCNLAREKLGLLPDARLTICVGRDGRLHSARFFTYLAKGIVAAGCDILDVGLLTSGMLYYSVFEHSAHGGIMITASHNPKEYNGAKFILKDASFTSDDVKKIATYDVSPNENGGKIRYAPITIKYQKLCHEVASRARGLAGKTIVWDCGNGAAGEIVSLLAAKLAGRNIVLFGDVDGNFPNHEADPSMQENLQDLIKSVKHNHADIGLAFDGDGDRIGVVLRSGEVIFGEDILLFLCQNIIPKYQNPKIILDVKCSPKVVDEVRRLGGIPVLCKTGHAFIKQKMAEENAILAGEMSGHIFVKDDYYGFDDGVFAACRILEHIDSFDVFCQNRPRYSHTISQKLEVADGFVMSDFIATTQNDFLPQNKLTCEINLLDGMRCEGQDFWFLVRKSNTEPCLTIRLESDCQAKFDLLYRYIAFLKF